MPLSSDRLPITSQLCSLDPFWLTSKNIITSLMARLEAGEDCQSTVVNDNPIPQHADEKVEDVEPGK